MLCTWILGYLLLATTSVVSVAAAVDNTTLDVGAIIAQLPQCTITCSLTNLAAAQCEITDMRNCLCTNTTLLNELFVCVQAACNLTEQAVSGTVSQQQICNGVPQPSRQAEIIRVVIVVSAVTFPILLLRLVSRYMLSKLWYDDWIVVASTIFLIPMGSIIIIVAEKGFGMHIWAVTPSNQTLLRQLYYVSQILYVLIQNMAKISILLLYLRIFPEQRFRLYTKLFILWIVLHTTAYLFAIMFQCVPIRSLWDLDLPSKCVHSSAMAFSGAAFSILEDLVIIGLPVPQLTGLNLGLKKKIALVVMFAVGSFACLTSMIRLKYLLSFSTQALDATWANVDVIIWSILEIFSAMICTSLISIRPLLVKYWPSKFGTTNQSTSRSAPKYHASSGGDRWGSRQGRAKGFLGVGSVDERGLELTSQEDLRDVESAAAAAAAGRAARDVKVTRDFKVTETRIEIGGREREREREKPGVKF